ncbi:MAG: hypothetical protein H7A35_01640 [Planctomycetales bacterium]|nr:hypothetical protein [bacterium]UNM08760.1 MAG: hypothetical protein H7A35_01640 [Planctomycetales bacterium]
MAEISAEKMHTANSAARVLLPSRLAAACLLLLLLASCGGSKSSSLDANNQSSQLLTVHGEVITNGAADNAQDDSDTAAVDPTASSGGECDIERIENFLLAELERLEKQRTASEAPGADSAVFNLSATRVSGPGEQLNRVELRWTKHLPGDYDGNGEVNFGDLVPLGQRWGQQVSYLPVEESGIDHFPAGDRHDNSLGRQNWLASYVDGNHDGVVGMADVTVIAQHWKQRYTGYRIYRRNLELGNGVLLPMPDVEDSPISVSREADDPVLREYAYIDSVGIPGSYQYTVRAWDEFTDTEAPEGNIASYLVNMQPIAEFDYEILVEDEPYTLSFSALGSNDPDGEIVSYAWDLDGDGEFADAADSAEIEAVLPAGFPLIQLRVTDDQGGQTVLSRNILLPSLLNVQLQVDESEAITPHTFTVNPVVSGSMPAVQYEWYEGADETPVALEFTPEPKQFTLNSPESTTARLKVKGEDGIYREASLLLQCHAEVSVTARPESAYGLAPATFTQSVTASSGADPLFRLVVDGNPQGEFNQQTSWLYVLQERGSAELQVEAIDKFGNTALSKAYTVKAQVLPDITFEYDPKIGTYPFDINWQITEIDDPDNLVNQILVRLPNGDTDPDKSVSLKGGTYNTSEGAGQSNWPYFRLTLDMFQYPDLATDYYFDSGYILADFSITPESYMGSGVNAEVDITEYDGYPSIRSHEWFVNGGYGSNLNEFHFTTNWLEPGIHEVRLEVENSIGDTRSFSHTMQVWPVETDVAIIRNDGGTYSTNIDAIKDDLDSLALSWQEFPYSDSIASDLLSHGHFVVLWYRGGPADAIEPRQETMWTTAEIDNYIALLEQGRPMLMMSQNSTRPSEHPEWSGGYETFFNADIQDAVVDADEHRLIWAQALMCDRYTGFGTNQWFEFAPVSFSGDVTGMIDRTIWDFDYTAEKYGGPGSSGYSVKQIVLEPGLQLSCTAYSNDFLEPVPPSGITGLVVTPLQNGFNLVYGSWGGTQTPYRNMGHWPNYSFSDHGNTRQWVVGFPWAAVDIADSVPPGMTRADMLQNIIGWLKVDYDPQF